MSGDGEGTWAPGRERQIVTVARNVSTRYLAIIAETIIGLVMLPFNLAHAAGGRATQCNEKNFPIEWSVTKFFLKPLGPLFSEIIFGLGHVNLKVIGFNVIFFWSAGCLSGLKRSNSTNSRPFFVMRYSSSNATPEVILDGGETWCK